MTAIPPLSSRAAISAIIREDWGRILASLTKSLGDLDIAEDALQDAAEAAIVKWESSGLPKSPAAWLISVARNKAIDRLRRRKAFQGKQQMIAALENERLNPPDMEASIDAIPDKRLELIFTCCQPQIPENARAALTLRVVGGLSTPEIARAFIVPEKTMAQRIVRAKKAIKKSGLIYEIPSREELPKRVSGVLQVIYLIFNEGYSASSGEWLVRQDLSNEAIRIGRILHHLMPEHAETAGLLALMQLHDSRRRARVGANGKLITLEHQDRKLWDAIKIEDGKKLLKQYLPIGGIGPYRLQAAISAVHSEAPSWDETDWPQIAALYALLLQLRPTPIIALNHAMAVSFADGPAAGLKIIGAPSLTKALSKYAPFYAARADMLIRLGDTSRAAADQRLAIDLSDNQAEKEHLQRTLRCWTERE